MSGRYAESEKMLERALRSIPLGAQTFSKSLTQLPRGVSPYFVERAKGSRVWDVDGNEYLDFVNSLAAIILGHCDPDVERAVCEQLSKGVTHSLSHPLEIEVAEKLCALVPCAERVRFGKNGSDATSAAVRLARAQLGRERVAVCGYHGWQDWYIGSTSRHRGVPAAVRELTHAFAYNDISSLARILDEHPGQFAAVILEPMNVVEPVEGFLKEVAELTRAHGAFLIFDETVTGFRFALGGAQELFGVTPDLATFGKGLANGFPLSALVGRSDIMEGLTEVFFSTTFGGETLSLAAARCVLEKMEREPVLATIAERGRDILKGLNALIAEQGLQEMLSVSGHPSWSFLRFADARGYSSWDLKTYYFQECFARGVLTLGTQVVSYAHSEADVARLLAVQAEVLSSLRRAVDGGTLLEELRCEPLKPLFSVRS